MHLQKAHLRLPPEWQTHSSCKTRPRNIWWTKSQTRKKVKQVAMAVLVIKCDGQAYLQSRDLRSSWTRSTRDCLSNRWATYVCWFALMIEFRSKHNEGGKTDRLCSTDFIYIYICDASGYTPLCFSAVFILFLIQFPTTSIRVSISVLSFIILECTSWINCLTLDFSVTIKELFVFEVMDTM